MEIMKTIGNYMKKDGLEMAKLLDKQKEKELVDGCFALLCHYFQCKTIVDGKSPAFYSLDSLYGIHNNMGYYDHLYNLIDNCTEDDLMNFSF